MANNRNLIRDKNLTLLKQFLFKKGTAFKAEMSEGTGISVVTINSLVKQLVDEKILIEGDLEKQPIGRPAYIYHFNYEQQHFLLLSIQEELTDTNKKLIILGKIVNLNGDLIVEERFDFNQVELNIFIEKVQYFLELGYSIDKIALSFPGKIYNGVVLSSWYDLFDNWKFEDALSKITSIPILIQNDAHLVTVGYTILKQLSDSETIVGVFYPENSMPGITIFDKGNILEGGHNLAGEAKYLPHLINNGMPKNITDLQNSLIEIISIYNAVIAPTSFVISADSMNQDNFLKQFEKSDIISKQINKPNLLFVDNFQESLTLGLRWLATNNSTYHF